MLRVAPDRPIGNKKYANHSRPTWIGETAPPSWWRRSSCPMPIQNTKFVM